MFFGQHPFPAGGGQKRFLPTSAIPGIFLSLWGGFFWFLCGVEAQIEGRQSAFYEGFEGPETSWRQAGADTPHRIEFHSRIRGEAHVGNGSERVRLVAGHGSYVYLAHSIGRSPVIDELLISVWVKSDRAGIQLLAQVVLPRSRHPRTGDPLTLVIPGTTYTQIGRWEQLRLQHVVQQVARQARVLRSQYGPQVDEREAYISHVLLNIYGGPGVTNLWIDDLDVAGLIVPSDETLPTFSAPLSSASSEGPRKNSSLPSGSNASASFSRQGLALPAGFSGPLEQAEEGQLYPRLVGGVLMVQGREFFPRIIQYRGESLAVLQNLGFNVVWFPTLPGPELLAEAERLGLWLICPPPLGPEKNEEKPSVQGIQERIPPEFQRVLAWDITLEPAPAHLETIAQWAQRVRRAETRSSRPFVSRTEGALQSLSRVVDIVWLTRPPLGTSLPLADYARWLCQRQLLVRPGTPLWVSIPTQWPPAIRAQWMPFGSGREIPENFSPEQIRLALYAALAGGVRGLVYESDRPLDAPDSESRTRAVSLELFNREIEILQPWLAAGNNLGPIQTSHPSLQASLFRTERSRLALVFWAEEGSQYVPGPASLPQPHFLLPGLPESHEAFQLLGGTLRPLRRDRLPGGTQINLEELNLTAAVVLSQDPSVISGTTKRASQLQRRLAELHHQLALGKFQEVQAVLSRLPTELPESQGPGISSLCQQTVGQTQDQLASCQRYLQNREYLSAILAAQRAQQALRGVERKIWESSIPGANAPIIWPLAGCFRMVPEHLAMVRQVRYSPAGPNLLVGGDVEDFQAMLAGGWRSGQGGEEIVEGSVELSPQAARSGRFGLRLVAGARQGPPPPELIERPPVWVITPPIHLQAGQIIRIQGWVQIPQPLQGSVDGLLITDSLGGEHLGWRIGKTSGWQPFEMYRLASQPGPVQVRFVLTGLGEVWLDDIVIQPILSGGNSIPPSPTPTYSISGSPSR